MYSHMQAGDFIKGDLVIQVLKMFHVFTARRLRSIVSQMVCKIFNWFLDMYEHVQQAGIRHSVHVSCP